MAAWIDFLPWAKDFIRLHGAGRLRDLRHGRRYANLSDWPRFKRCDECDVPIWVDANLATTLRSNWEGRNCRVCGLCAACCSCTLCMEGNSRRQHYTYSACEHCSSCTDHCDCNFCNDCGDECHDNYCGSCSNCENCCTCNDTCEVEFFDSPLTFHASNKYFERKALPSGRFISAEIEVANISEDTVSESVRQWHASIVEDGSLGDGGFEINTAPASGDQFVKQITQICDALNEGNAAIDRSCGLHVHIDARDFNYYDIRRLAYIYSFIEPVLYRMVPASRQDNRYAVPCARNYATELEKRDYNTVRKEICNMVYGVPKTADFYRKGTPDPRGYGRYKVLHDESVSYRKNKYPQENRGNRYRALNLHSWFYRGTVECRLFNGTVEPSKIIGWGGMWAMILDWVKTHSDQDAKDLVMGGGVYPIMAPLRALWQMVTHAPTRQFMRSRLEKYAPQMVVDIDTVDAKQLRLAV